MSKKTMKPEAGELLFAYESAAPKERIIKLINDGADLEERDEETNATILILACRDGDTWLVPLLIEKGADLDAKDKDESTALMYASWNGFTEVVRLLIEKGADLHLKDAAGNDALDAARSDGRNQAAAVIEREEEILQRISDSSIRKPLVVKPIIKFGDL